ncbi:MAG: hypothetical protein JO195_04450 [Candidatus Eremiobacteraeota bacterium]|nr:hypothetical protein [Candidatus Eremiobacteraeota bacterium]
MIRLVIGLLVLAWASIAFESLATGASAQSLQPRHSVIGYRVEPLLTQTGGGVAEGISNRGWVVGSACLAGCRFEHAFLWRDGVLTDLGTLGGPNSSEQWPVGDDRGLVVGAAETARRDPLGENVCGFGTGLICLGFLWHDGLKIALPPVGGNNSEALGVNNRGQVAGYGETAARDPGCIPPQKLDFEALIWGPKSGEVMALPPLTGDTISGAVGIDDREQVVGVSGTCSNPTRHAVLWHDGTVTNLGNLGGVLNTFPWAINANGDIVGQSDLLGDSTTHAFLWTKQRGMLDLGLLSGDGASLAFGLNDRGDVVGGSCSDASYQSCRAFLWQDGVLVDLNKLACSPTSLHLFFGNDINDRGEIVGYAFDESKNEFVGFIAFPQIITRAVSRRC